MHLLHGIYFGIVLIMLIYNTVIFFTVRDRAYLYLVFYAGAQMLLMASSDGFGQLYLWSGLPWLQQALPPLGLAGLQVVGGDVVEVAPQYDPSTNTVQVAAQIVLEILSLMVLAPTQ